MVKHQYRNVTVLALGHVLFRGPPPLFFREFPVNINLHTIVRLQDSPTAIDE